MTQVFRLPWPAAAASLVAMAALFVSSGGSWSLPLLALGLLGPYLTPARLNDQVWTRWTARIILFTFVVATSAGQISSGTDLMFDPGTVHSFGQLCAAELVIQCWRTKPDGGQRGVMVVLLSALVFLAASNTYQTAYIRLFTPVYMLFLILAMREFRPASAAAPPRVHSPFATGWLLGALILVLSLGALTSYELLTNRDTLLQWDAKLLGEQQFPQSVGLSSTPTLNSSFDVAQSPARVLRIDGDLNENHLRGMAFDTYTVRRWSPALESRRQDSIDPAQLAPSSAGSQTRFTRMADENGLVFVPLNAAGFKPEEPGELIWDGASGGPLRTRAVGPYHYDIIQSADEHHQGPFCTPLTLEERVRCLVVPNETDPKVRALAETIGRGQSEPSGRATAVVQYLLSNYGYSQTFNAGAGDPISTFILAKKPAHCQFFASAAVVLLRCLGVPARYVQGYYAHESGGAGVTIVRQRDAHAWAEAWIDGQGWVTLDATPGDGRPDHTAPGLPIWQKDWEWLQDRTSAIRQWVTHLHGPQKTTLIAALVLFLLVALGWRLVRRQPAPVIAGASYAPPDKLLAAFAVRFESLLARNGTPCPPGRPWQEHLLKAATEREPSLGQGTSQAQLDLPTAERFVHEYYGIRFGGAGDGENVRLLEELLAEMDR